VAQVAMTEEKGLGQQGGTRDSVKTRKRKELRDKGEPNQNLSHRENAFEKKKKKVERTTLSHRKKLLRAKKEGFSAVAVGRKGGAPRRQRGEDKGIISAFRAFKEKKGA